MTDASPPGGTPRQSLVLDTDGGTDDAVAVWWALGEPGVEVLAVLATAGNVDGDTAAANVGRILRAAGRQDVPVVRGSAGRTASPAVPGGGADPAVRATRARPTAGPAGPAGRANGAGRAGSVHGPDGLGGTAGLWPLAEIEPVAEPAAEVLARLTCLHTGEIDLVTLGPLTTLAAALRIDPGLATRLRTLTVMGGVLAPGARTVRRDEANVGHDPPAAAQVLAAPWATVMPPSLIGLDVTLSTLLAPEDLVTAASGRTPAARFLAEPLRRYARHSADAGRVPPGTCPCHDLLAVLAATHPAVVTEAEERRLTVEGEPAGPGVPWRVATAADTRRFRSAFRALVAAPPL